jgi:hypothetical protein
VRKLIYLKNDLKGANTNFHFDILDEMDHETEITVKKEMQANSTYYQNPDLEYNRTISCLKI